MLKEIALIKKSRIILLHKKWRIVFCIYDETFLGYIL